MEVVLVKTKLLERGVTAREGMELRQKAAIELLRAAGKVPQPKLLARFQLELQVSGRKAIEYLRLFRDAGYCTIDDSGKFYGRPVMVVADTYREPKKKGRPSKKRR